MILYVGFAHDPLAVTYPREKYEYNPVANLILYASFRKTKKLSRECDEQKTYTLHEVCNVKYML